MKKIIIVSLLIIASAVSKAQNVRSTAATRQFISADKNTVATSGNTAVQINATAVPFSAKDSIAQSYPGYHTTIVTGNEQQEIEKTGQAAKANSIQNNPQKKAINVRQAQNNNSPQEVEVTQTAAKAK